MLADAISILERLSIQICFMPYGLIAVLTTQTLTYCNIVMYHKVCPNLRTYALFFAI